MQQIPVLTSRGVNQTPTYQAIPPSGQDNTASNLAGIGLFAQKVGVDLQFKGLIAGDNVTLTPSETGITISAIGGGSSGITSLNANTDAAQVVAASTGLVLVSNANIHIFSIDDTVVTLDGIQSLANKSIDGDMNTLSKIAETSLTVEIGGAGLVLTSNGIGQPPTYQASSGGCRISFS